MEHPPLTFTIPRISTPRLLLREFRMADFEAFAANLADPEVAKYISSTNDKRTAWRHFAAASGQWVLQGRGWWAVELNETKEVVGSIGAFIRETAPDLELGWSIYRRFWGKGIATEGAKAALDVALKAQDCPKRVVAHIDATNPPSLKVAEKLGMKFEAEVDFYGERIGRYLLEA
jgi:RimJ/RimL family protein N-acetyltransferase